jgi:hypothetical protein
VPQALRRAKYSLDIFQFSRLQADYCRVATVIHVFRTYSADRRFARAADAGARVERIIKTVQVYYSVRVECFRFGMGDSVLSVIV